jgi:CHASE2 domain-containing sensor protein
MAFSLHNALRLPRRPYWLLLVLALFLAGQVASASHWHEAATAPADADCALCILSSANGAAAIAEGWQLPATPPGVFLALFLLVVARRAAVRFHDSRAPPSLLNSCV